MAVCAPGVCVVLCVRLASSLASVGVVLYGLTGASNKRDCMRSRDHLELGRLWHQPTRDTQCWCAPCSVARRTPSPSSLTRAGGVHYTEHVSATEHVRPHAGVLSDALSTLGGLGAVCLGPYADDAGERRAEEWQHGREEQQTEAQAAALAAA
eukprot:5721711-Prymnesium_polylepis.1